MSSPAWSDRIALLRDEAGASPVPRRAARHLAEVGRIWLEHLDGPAEAERAFEEAMACDPHHLGALRALTRLAEVRGDWPRACTLLERQLAAAPAADRPGLLLRLATLFQDRLGNQVGARARLLEAIAEDPDDPEIRLRLSLATPRELTDARLTLLQRRLEARGANVADLHARMGAVAEGVPGRDEAALQHYRAALDHDPGHDAALRGLCRIHVRAERWEALAAALADAAPSVPDPERRGRLAYLAAVIHVARLDGTERARPLLGQAAVLLTDDASVLRELVTDYELLGMWGPANALLERLADRSDETAAARAWYRIGLNAESGLGRQDQAVAAWRRALDLDPAFLPAMAALRRHAWAHDDLDAADQALAALAGLAPDDATRAALRTHRAHLAERRGESSAERWSEALRASTAGPPESAAGVPVALPGRLRALTARGDAEGAAALLETWLERPLEPWARTFVARHLADLYEALGRGDQATALYRTLAGLLPDDPRPLRSLSLRTWGDSATHVDVLERLAAVEPDDARRASLQHRIAELHESVGAPDLAERAWRRVLETAPGDLRALHGLGRLLHHHGRWADLADLVRAEVATLAPQDPRRAGLLGRLAEICEFHLERPDEAIAAYLGVLELKPHAPDALAGLERLYGGRDRWAELGQVLRRRAALISEPRDRAAVLFRLAEVEHEHLGRLDAAVDLYESALELAPDVLPAAWALERVALARGDRQRLAALYRALLPRLQSRGQRALAAHKLAALLPPHEGRTLLGEVQSELPDDVPTTWALVRDAAERNDRAELSSRLALLAQQVGERRDAVALWREAAENAEDADAATETRIALWERVLPLDPDASRPWEALLCAWRDFGARADLAAFLGRLARASDDDRTRSVARWSAGLLEASSDLANAQAHFAEALAACADDPMPAWLVLDRARAHVAESDDDAAARAALASALEEAARRQRDGVSAARLLVEAGDLWARDVAMADRALLCWLEAVRRDALEEGAARRVEEALRAQARWAELVAVHQRRLRRLDAPEARIDLARRLAELQLDALGDREGARQTLALLVDLRPDDVEARVRLGALDASEGRHAEAVLSYERAAAATQDERLLVELWTRLGRLKARHLGDVAGAVADLRRAVGLLDPEARALEALAEVYVIAGDAEAAKRAWRQFERIVDDPNRRAAARARLTQVRDAVRAGQSAPRAHADLGEVPIELDETRGMEPVELRDTAGAGQATPSAPDGSGEVPIELDETRGMEPVEIPAPPTAPRPSPSELTRGEVASEVPVSPPATDPTPPDDLGPALLETQAMAAWSPAEASPADTLEATPEARPTLAYFSEAHAGATEVGMPALSPAAPAPGAPRASGAVVEAPARSTRPMSGPTSLAIGRLSGPLGASRAEPATATEAQARRARGRIEENPLDGAAWSDLAEATDDAAGKAWLEDVVAWTEGRIRSTRPHTAPGTLPDALRRPLLPLSVPHAVLALLRSVADVVGPAFCAEPAARPAGPEDAFPPDDPLVAAAARLAPSLGAPPVLLRRNPARPYTVAVEAGLPAAIVLGSAIIEGGDPAGRSFLLARCMAPLAEGSLVARRLTDREFAAFLGALLTVLDADYPVRARDRATYERMVARLEPLLPPARRTALAPLARAAADGLPAFPAAAIRLGLETYGARLALALADGFGGAFEMLRLLDFDDRPRGALEVHDLAQFLADNDLARDLLVFAASPAALAIRKWLKSNGS